MAAGRAELVHEAADLGVRERVVLGHEGDVLVALLVEGVLAEAGHPLGAVRREPEEVRGRVAERRVLRSRRPVDERLVRHGLGVVLDRQALVTGQGADQDVDVVLLDELLGLLERDGRRGVRAFLEELDLVAVELPVAVAAFFGAKVLSACSMPRKPSWPGTANGPSRVARPPILIDVLVAGARRRMPRRRGTRGEPSTDDQLPPGLRNGDIAPPSSAVARTLVPGRLKSLRREVPVLVSSCAARGSRHVASPRGDWRGRAAGGDHLSRGRRRGRRRPRSAGRPTARGRRQDGGFRTARGGRPGRRGRSGRPGRSRRSRARSAC